jgi:SAM-dependent methyltransferase
MSNNRLSINRIKNKAKAYLSIKKKFSHVKEALTDEGRFSCEWSDRKLILGEDTDTTSFDTHYVYHTAWAARILANKQPKLHVDISSDLRFVTLVSAFIPIDFYDYRPVEFALSGLESKRGDLMALPFENNSVVSISCMHVVEHIGLERYGDPLDPKGDIKAIAELKRVLKPGGDLFFVVPVGGKAQIQYNAHRIYTFELISTLFKELQLKSFALVTDSGEFIGDATQQQADQQQYGCGCWLFTK